MSQELVAILDGRETGRVMRDDRGKLSFTYNEPWRTAADAYPLSISMPLALAGTPRENRSIPVGGFCRQRNRARPLGAQIPRLGKERLRLIACVGEDCAGAVQFVRPKGLKPSWERPRPDRMAR